MLEFRAVIIYSTGHFQLRVGGTLEGKSEGQESYSILIHHDWFSLPGYKFKFPSLPSHPLLLKSKRAAIVVTKKVLSNCLPKLFPALQPSSIAICLYLNASGFPALTTCLKSNYYWVNVTTLTLGNQNKFLLFTSIFFNTQNYMILEKEIQNKLICETIKIFPVTDSKVHINMACLIIIFYKDCKQEKKTRSTRKKINIFASKINKSIKFYTMTF